nr:hypothetical protein [Candidatus Liberibacter asiaticus]
MREVWTSQLAPRALQNLVDHAHKPNHIVYTTDSNQYAATPLSSFMRKLFSCHNGETLHQAYFPECVRNFTLI